MKLGYFTMPLHPPHRNYTEILREDRDAIVLADKLGFDEAFIGEHTSDTFERITSSLIFIASLGNITKNIKLGCGTINLPNGHPTLFSSHIAMLDHMLEGRFIMGISAGALASDAEAFETLNDDRGAMFIECIDQILEIWQKEAPYNIRGKYWSISTQNTYDIELGLGILPKPLQSPHPEIVCPALAPFSAGVAAAAARGWHPISSNFLTTPWVASHWLKYVEGCKIGNHTPLTKDWRVGRTIFVADDHDTAIKYAKGSDGPYAFLYNQIFLKLKKAGRLVTFKNNFDDEDDKITVQSILETNVIAGTPDEVTTEILKFREVVGDFGTIVYTGIDWQNPKLARRSMELMAGEVLPRINKALANESV